jgi:hypothetical protein
LFAISPELKILSNEPANGADNVKPNGPKLVIHEMSAVVTPSMSQVPLGRQMSSLRRGTASELQPRTVPHPNVTKEAEDTRKVSKNIYNLHVNIFEIGYCLDPVKDYNVVLAHKSGGDLRSFCSLGRYLSLDSHFGSDISSHSLCVLYLGQQGLLKSHSHICGFLQFFCLRPDSQSVAGCLNIE